MVRARTEFKAEVRQFKLELDRAKTIIRMMPFFQPDEEVIYFQESFLESEIQVMFSEVDVEITRDEILKSFKKLKNGKSGGPDRLLNVFLFMVNILSCLHSLF